MVTQSTADSWDGGSNPGQQVSPAGRASNRRPESSRPGCITIQPLLAVIEIFHGAVVKEEGHPPPPSSANASLGGPYRGGGRAAAGREGGAGLGTNPKGPPGGG